MRYLAAALSLACSAVGAAEMPIVDAHVHYSHDAWEMLPPEKAVQALRDAGLRRAFVSSSGEGGAARLFALAPDLVVPVLRPYRRRGETGTWTQDASVIDYVEARLDRHDYAGIGEFHAFGADVDTPVMRRMVELARERGLFLHLHGDADAVHRVYAQDPEARVLWAHSGFDEPGEVKAMLARYPLLWCDLAFRNDPVAGGELVPAWRQLLEAFPDRFMVGTDTYTPERWLYVAEHAAWARGWLASLPDELARRVAYENAEGLLGSSKR